MKKYFGCALLCVLLAGCQFNPPEPPNDMPEAPIAEAALASRTDHWLEARRELCLLPAQEQRKRLETLAAKAPRTDREEKITRLLLATCQPDLTPGLLREALSDLTETGDWSPAEQSLIQLVRDLARSYRILEEKNQQLANQLEAIINGIRVIETELDGIETNGATP